MTNKENQIEEMEKETIIRALECCTRGRKGDDIPCTECPYNECNIVGGRSERQTSGTCRGWLMKDALALIKELTEELEKERTWADSMIDNLRDDVRELTKENERLNNDKGYWKKRAENAELEYDKAVKKGYKYGRADTVREMQERLKAVCWSCIMTPSTIDRIAKEILEE